MPIKWFDATEAERFGQSLAQHFIKNIPAAPGKQKIKNMTGQLQAVEQMYSKIEQFKLNNSLNIYKKAKLGRAFKDELTAAGYKPDFVDQITKGVLLKL